jgi:riboflavin synthase
LIEETGRLLERTPRGGAIEVVIAAPLLAPAADLGDSIAVDGCCLTVEKKSGEQFTAFATPETLEKTVLGDRPVGGLVNLESSLTLQKKLGGHLVQGHVDGQGAVHELSQDGESWTLKVEIPSHLAEQCIVKGSIAIDGISLTIADLVENIVTVAVIPETYKRTSLQERQPGDPVNIEADMIGKYVHKMLSGSGLLPTQQGAAVTTELLKRAGFISSE